MVTKNRTNKLFPSLQTQLPSGDRPLFDFTLLVDAPYTIKLSIESQEASLLDLMRWAGNEYKVDHEVISGLAYTLLFRLLGVDGLVEATTSEEWMQLGKDVRDRLVRSE